MRDTFKIIKMIAISRRYFSSTLGLLNSIKTGRLLDTMTPVEVMQR